MFFDSWSVKPFPEVCTSGCGRGVCTVSKYDWISSPFPILIGWMLALPVSDRQPKVSILNEEPAQCAHRQA